MPKQHTQRQEISNKMYLYLSNFYTNGRAYSKVQTTCSIHISSQFDRSYGWSTAVEHLSALSIHSRPPINSSNSRTTQKQLMTNMFDQSEKHTSEYLRGLAEEGNEFLHGIEVLLERFELPPIQRQTLVEAAEQLSRVINTIENVKTWTSWRNKM